MTGSNSIGARMKAIVPEPGPWVVIGLIAVFGVSGSATLFVMADSIGVQESTVEGPQIFENIELKDTSLVIQFSEPAEEGRVAEIYAVGPDGTVVSRSEVLPRQTVQQLDIQRRAEWKTGVEHGQYTVVALDESGNVVSEATVTIRMGDWL